MCLICTQNVPILTIGGYSRCEHCSTYIAKVLPKKEGVQKVLEEHASSFILGARKSLELNDYEARLAILKRFSKTVQTILDFGCGNGNFVKFLLAKGYKTLGYDKSEILKKYLISQRIPMYKNIGDIPKKHFDVVTCFDVIEHTVDPSLLILTMGEKLKKGGILLISTPNSRGLSAMILGKRWWVFGPSAHFILFSPFSFKLFLTSMGFNLLYMRTDTFTPWFKPSERFLAKILNKIVYLVFFSFQGLLFNNQLGDNILVVAKLAP